MNGFTFKILLFLILSGWFFLLSRKSMRVIGSHGFYRFFAWEFILALFLMNYPLWFSDPFSTAQIVSWFFLVVALYLVAQGMYLILMKGKPGNQRNDNLLFQFERTTRLVTAGVYRYIRHPLYASLLFLAWGMFLKSITWYSGGAIVAATLLLIATAKADEIECIRYFGADYEEYMKRTKMFIPYLI